MKILPTYVRRYILTRIARWDILKPKIPIWVNFVGPFGLFYDHLEYFMVIWYILPVLVYCVKKNLAALIPTAFKSNEFATIRLTRGFY
jgi:hypothetical protein